MLLKRAFSLTTATGGWGGRRKSLCLTCGLEPGHEPESEDDEEASHESGHPDLLKLFVFQDLEEGDVEQGAAGKTLEKSHDEDLGSCK